MLKCVSQIEMDAALQIEQLEDTLANLSDPYFVFEKETKIVCYKVSMCRLSTNVCMLHFLFSSLFFTLLFYVSGVVFLNSPIYP